MQAAVKVSRRSDINKYIFLNPCETILTYKLLCSESLVVRGVLQL
jgi:hypothetical protein